jgi:biotin synthase
MDNATYQRIDEITQHELNDGETSATEGQWLIGLHHDYLPWLMAGADRTRKTNRGDQIEVCAISNVRSGNCSQSGHHKDTNAPVYGFIDSSELTEQAKRAREWGASDFGVVSKGWGLRSDKERKQLGEYCTKGDECRHVVLPQGITPTG